MRSLLEHLLIKKHSDRAEIEVHLFENCNMSCAFCCQDHIDEGLTKEGFDKKLSLVMQFIDHKENDWKKFSVNLMGGELFQDKFSDDYFVKYEEFILKISERLKDKDVSYCITSNLVFENHQRVTHFLKALKSKGLSLSLATSYDFVARGWNPEQKKLFLENLNVLEDYISSVSITLHSLSIKKMLTQIDPIFEDLYKRFEVNFDWYIPDLRNDKVFHPSDSECKEALIFLAKNYPNSHPVKEYLNQEINAVQCCSNSRVIISANNKYSNCQYMDYDPKNFKTPLNRHSTVEMFDRFTEEQGCLSCEHFDRCGFYCWVAADYSHRNRDTQKCFISEFFNEVLPT